MIGAIARSFVGARLLVLVAHPLPLLPPPRASTPPLRKSPPCLFADPADRQRAGQAPSRQEREESRERVNPEWRKRAPGRAHLTPPLSEIPSMLRSASAAPAAPPLPRSLPQAPPDKVSGLLHAATLLAQLLGQGRALDSRGPA